MVDRIRDLIQHKGLSSSQFADEIGVPRAIISHILSGRNKPSLDVVLKLIATYRDISMDWLLLGEGEMLNNLAAKAPPAGVVRETMASAPKSEPVHKAQEADQVPFWGGDGKQGAKPIERVILFYADKTFSVFAPEV